MKPFLVICSLGALAATASAQSSLWTDPRGLPSGVQWIQKIDDRTSSTFRTYQNGSLGETVSFNPKTSEVVRNPTNGIYEAVIREDLIKEKSEEENSSEADPVWPKESGSITISSDATELAKNLKGELEEVVSEDAITAEVWKERVPGGQSEVNPDSTPAPEKSQAGDRKINSQSPVGRWVSPLSSRATMTFASDGRWIATGRGITDDGQPANNTIEGTWKQYGSTVQVDGGMGESYIVKENILINSKYVDEIAYRRQ